MKKIIITGGLGYIGTELCKIYSGYSWNDKIIIIDNRFISERVNQIRNWNMDFIHGDILDKGLVEEHFKDADIGHQWQIRTVGSNKNHNLIVRYADPNPHFYALIEVQKCLTWARDEDTYKATFKGWIKGKDAKQARYLTDFGYKDRPKVFSVPYSELKPTSWYPL